MWFKKSFRTENKNTQKWIIKERRFMPQGKYPFTGKCQM